MIAMLKTDEEGRFGNGYENAPQPEQHKQDSQTIPCLVKYFV